MDFSSMEYSYCAFTWLYESQAYNCCTYIDGRAWNYYVVYKARYLTIYVDNCDIIKTWNYEAIQYTVNNYQAYEQYLDDFEGYMNNCQEAAEMSFTVTSFPTWVSDTSHIALTASDRGISLNSASQPGTTTENEVGTYVLTYQKYLSTDDITLYICHLEYTTDETL